MTQSEFIAVIDLGTYKIKGVVARRNDNNVFQYSKVKPLILATQYAEVWFTTLKKPEQVSGN